MAKAATPSKGKPAQSTPNVPARAGAQGPLIVVTDNPDKIPDHIRAAMASNRGSENVGADDLVIPRLEVIQTLSKALDRGHANFINGAKEGDLINSVTRRVYGKRVIVIPVHYSKQYLVWKDIKKGGGFFGAFDTPDDADRRAQEEGGVGDKTGIEIIDTPVHLCLIVDQNSGAVDEIMVSMPRTKAKISRSWNSMIRMAGGDRFARAYAIQTQQEEKNGNKYYNFAVAQFGFPAPALFKQAEKLYSDLQKGGKRRVMDVSNLEEGLGPRGGDDDKDM